MAKVKLCENESQTLRADFFNGVYFSRDLTCNLGLTNNLIDGSQPKAKNGL